MKKFLIFVLVIVAAFLVYKYAFKKEEKPREKPVPLAVSQHSDAFNQSVDNILADYYAMTNAFVNWDEEGVKNGATGLQQSLSKFNAEDLKKDSTIYQTVLFPWENAKKSAAAIVSSTEWTAKRQALQDLSDNLRTILLTVKYDRAVVYWQECPMAFGEDKHGNWLSAEEEVVNPYLGNKDPKYGNSMLNCGETKMKIDFTAADTTPAG